MLVLKSDCKMNLMKKKTKELVVAWYNEDLFDPMKCKKNIGGIFEK